MAPTLAGLINPHGLNAPINRPREMSLPDISLQWGLDPVTAGLDAITLADMAGQLGVGLGGPMPPSYGGDTASGQAFRNRAMGALTDLASPGLQQTVGGTTDATKNLPVVSAGDPAVGPTRRELEAGRPDPAAQGAIAPVGPTTQWLGSSSSTVSGRDPKQMAAGQAKIDKAAELQQGLADEESAEAEERIAERNVIAAETESKVAQDELEREPDIQIARQERDAQIAELQTAVDEAKQDIDPDRWWGSRGTGQKIAIIAASMLGGFTEGFTWGKVKNRALEMIDAAIDRDVRAQEVNINNARAQRGEMRGMVGILNGKLGELETAKSAFRAAAYEDMARRFKVLGENSQDQTVAKKAQAMVPALLERAGIRQQEAADRWTKTRGGHQAIVQPAAAAGGKATQASFADIKTLDKALGQLDSYSDAVMRKRESVGGKPVAEPLQEAVRNLPLIGHAIPQSETGAILGQAKGIAMELARAKGNVNPSDKDVEAMVSKLLSLNANKPAALTQIDNQYGDLLTSASAGFREAAARGDRAAMQQYLGFHQRAKASMSKRRSAIQGSRAW